MPIGRHLERRFGLLFADLVGILLRQREADENRLQLRDGDQSRRIGRPHHVAGIDQLGAEPAVDRRADVGKAEINPGILDLRLVGLDPGLQLRHQRLLLVIGLARFDALRHQLSPAHQVLLGARQLRLVLLLGRVGLVDRRLERPRIDL